MNIDPSTMAGDSDRPLKPGDEVRTGTPGSADNVCRRCGGSGMLHGVPCTDCKGTGIVTTNVGDA
jgi:hypothetical protein